MKFGVFDHMDRAGSDLGRQFGAGSRLRVTENLLHRLPHLLRAFVR